MSVICTGRLAYRTQLRLWLGFGRCAGARGLVRDTRRDPSSNDDVAGLEALGYWTHLCDCARRKTDVRLFVSNEYLSFRFGFIIEPTGFIMNKHT